MEIATRQPTSKVQAMDDMDLRCMRTGTFSTHAQDEPLAVRGLMKMTVTTFVGQLYQLRHKPERLLHLWKHTFRRGDEKADIDLDYLYKTP